MLFSDNACILFGCQLLACIENWSYTSTQNGQFAFPSKGVIWRLYVNSKNKQYPNPSRYILYKDSNVFNGFHHYSHYIEYFSMNCALQPAKSGVVVSDSPVPVTKIDACKSNISIFTRKITKMLVLT